MQSRDEARREWLVKVGVVLPALLAVAGVYTKSLLTHWPVGPHAAALLGALIVYLACCFLFSHKRDLLEKLALVVWSLLGTGLVILLLLPQVKEFRERPPSIPSSMVGNELAGYLDNPPDWWAQYAQEFKQAWHMQWHPYLRWRHQPFLGQWIHIDALGRRQTWNPPDSSTSRHRIFTFGGSTMWGNCARDDFTIASQISRLLQEAGRPAEVTNFGESGYVTTQELIQLILELRAGNIPESIVFYDGANDIFSAFQNRVPGTPQNEEKMRGLMQDLLDKNYVAANPGQPAAKEPWRDRSPLDDPALIEQELDTYVRNLAMIETLAQRFHFQTVYYWQPCAYVGKTLTPDETLRVEKHGPQMAHFFRSAYARVATLKPPGRFRDLSQVFATTTNSLYLDFCHVREEGNERVARAIVNDLVPLLSQDRRIQISH